VASPLGGKTGKAQIEHMISASHPRADIYAFMNRSNRMAPDDIARRGHSRSSGRLPPASLRINGVADYRDVADAGGAMKQSIG
jgi:hypothetical protein